MARLKIEWWNTTDWQDILFQEIDSNQFKFCHFVDTEPYDPEFVETKETENNKGKEVLRYWKLEKELKIFFIDIEPVAYAMKTLPQMDNVYITDKQGDRVKVRVSEVNVELKNAGMYNIEIKYVIDTLLKTGCETNKSVS